VCGGGCVWGGGGGGGGGGEFNVWLAQNFAITEIYFKWNSLSTFTINLDKVWGEFSQIL